MPITYDIENDYLYLKGIERGIECGALRKENEEKYLSVKNILLETDFDSIKIAKLVRVTIEFVEKIKSELNEKNNERKF